VDDGSTVPLYYDNRGEQLGITTDEVNELVDAQVAELELDEETEARVRRVKAVAQELVGALRAEIAAMHDWRASEITQAQVHSLIYNFLYSDRTGLPDAYASDEIKALSGEVYRYVFTQFPGIGSSTAAHAA
jgi:type I restriction enzyme R subunit